MIARYVSARFLILTLISLGCVAGMNSSQRIEVAVDPAGTVHIPAFAVPLSRYMSDEARARFISETAQRKNSSTEPSEKKSSVSENRKFFDEWMRPKVDRAKEFYPVDIEEKKFGNVRAQIVTPKSGVAVRNKRRVLINLHGGGFMVGSGLHALAEAIPISAVERIKVVAIDYRLAPEYKFPAASEDVTAVYRELLSEYEPRSIGIFGCSAGGTLAAMAVAWFQREKLPPPGAIGILSAAAFGNFYSPNTIGSWGGDSRYIAPPLVGDQPLQLDDASQVPADAYLSNTNLADPLVSPALYPGVLAKFPPTLLITGTRAWDMSAAVQTHRELIKVGVEADLHLWDGLGHCFFLDGELPESREAYDVVAKFFDKHLSNP